MNRPLRFLSLLLLSVSTAQADQIFDNGVPDLLEGMELTRWREAERFTVSNPVIIGHVRLWDFEAAPGAFSGSFLWEIRANSATNRPGVILYTGTSTNLVRFATGRRAAFLNWPESVNTFDLPAASLAPGTYWLVLHNGPLSNNAGQDFFWEGAINPSTDASMHDIAPFANNWRSNSTSGAPLSKLAFQLFGVPEAARPHVTAVKRTSGASPRISFTTQSGRSYRVQFKNMLMDSAWTPVAGAENVAGTGGEVEIVDSDPNAAGLTRRFYQVTLNGAPPPPPILSPAETPLHRNDERARGTDAPENSLRRRLPSTAPQQ